MIQAVTKGFCRLFGQVDIAADIGILKAELADLVVECLFPVLGDQRDVQIQLGLTDGTDLIGFIDLEHADRKAALGGGVDIDQVEVLVVQVVRRLAADKEHP